MKDWINRRGLRWIWSKAEKDEGKIFNGQKSKVLPENDTAIIGGFRKLVWRKKSEETKEGRERRLDCVNEMILSSAPSSICPVLPQ